MAKKNIEIIDVFGQELLLDYSSKSRTWKFKDHSPDVAFNIRIQLINKYDYVSLGSIVVNNGNPEQNKSVTVISKFRDKVTGKIKTIKNTITNYYDNDNNNIYLGTSANPIKHSDTYTKLTAKEYSSKAEDTFLYGASTSKYTIDATTSKLKIYDDSGKDNYTVNNSSRTDINDFVGNDVYTLNSAYVNGNNAGEVYVYDYDGKDSYTITNNSSKHIYDYKGNDTYLAKDNVNTAKKIVVQDTSGKDKYTVDANGKLIIEDSTGSDKYFIKKDAYHFNTIDSAGNDTYTFNDANFTLSDFNASGSANIVDITGKDIYKITNSSNISIYEYDYKNIGSDTPANLSGNDKYTITDSSLLKISETSINSGNDKYIFKNVDNTGLSQDTAQIEDAAGKDKYTVTGSKNLYFKDSNGADTWKITTSDLIKIYDELGGDKYTVKLGEDISITDNDGVDSYKIVGTKANPKKKIEEAYAKNISVTDASTASGDTYTLSYTDIATLTDKGGKDVYKISNSKNITISDEGLANDAYTLTNTDGITISDSEGNDKYTIAKTFGMVKINDMTGEKDSLIFSNAKQSNLVFMGSATVLDGGEYDTTLYIFDKSKGGYVCIDNYFTATELGFNDKTQAGTGCIETIKIGKKSVNAFGYVENFNELQSQVAGFIGADKEYSTIKDALDSGDETVLNQLLACFDPSAQQ